jgi:predicted metal-dependent phosphoesterase TrpH
LAIAITDHDTLGGIRPGQDAAVGTTVEVIAAVEISADYRGTELHLLGYFVQPNDRPLLDALHRLAKYRRTRFWDMVERLRACGVALRTEELGPGAETAVPGRRHLAEALVRIGRAGSVREAFHRYLGDGGRVATPKWRLPVDQALDLVRAAGGVASWAHPSYDCDERSLAELRSLGLGALEACYPTFTARRTRELRALAAACRLAVTGGSDCHGPDQPRRGVGACSITAAELERLRQLASSGGH